MGAMGLSRAARQAFKEVCDRLGVDSSELEGQFDSEFVHYLSRSFTEEFLYGMDRF